MSERSQFRSGFTLVEFLACIAIVSLLTALLLPAVVQIRESARRSHCQSNLRQIGVATELYAEANGQLPDFRCGGLLYGILPGVEQSAAYELAADKLRINDREGAKRAIGKVPVYLCPDDVLAQEPGDASYAINFGLLDAVGIQRGFLRTPATWSAVTDGLSQTALVSEVCLAASQSGRGGWVMQFVNTSLPMTLDQVDSAMNQCVSQAESRPADRPGSGSGRVLSFNGGYNHLLPPNSPRCVSANPPFEIIPPWSGHPQGANVLWADGSVRFVSDRIDRRAWLAVGSINGNEIVEVAP